MTLIVETGAGLPNAQSYVSAVDCAAYHAARGNSSFGSMIESQQEQAIIRAMDFLSLYGPKWKGERVTDIQALDWPRRGVRLDSDRCPYLPATMIPVTVVKALCEMALRAGAGELVADAEREVIEETIGPITTKWAPGSVAPEAQFTAVALMLKPLLQSSSGVRLVRA